jgi:methyl-accepting chemotaxis protein
MQSLDDFPSFLELGEWTTRHIRPLFEIFRDENVAPALALTIVAIAIALCVLFALNTTYIRSQVRRRTRAVRRTKDKAEFAESMPQVERLMLRSRYLRHSWRKFRETLIEPTAEDEAQGRKVILNTARPQEYFNTSEAGLRFPLYRAMPNLLVGIGLLLTFFGLVTALYFTTDAIRMAADLTASQSALRDLLYAASFKFYTSIAGLGGSIVLTIVIRYGTAAVESTFDALASALEAKLVFVTPESIAFDHYREAQEQTKNLRLFNTEIAISVGKRIEEALAATLPAFLAQAMAPIGRSLDEVASKLTSMNEGAIGEMAGSFADKLQEATGDQMRGLADTLAKLTTSLEKTNQGLTQGGTSLADSVARSSQDVRDAVAAMTSALKQAGGDFGSGLETAANKLEAASDRMATHTEEAVAAVRRGLVDEAASIAHRIARAAVDAGEESRLKVVGAGSDLAETVSDMGQQLTGAVNAIQDGLMGAVREMQNIERSIGQHVVAMNQLSKATQDAEGAMTRSAQSMREAGAPLAETSRQMADASRRIADATASAERSISGAQVEIREIGQLLHVTMETTAQQWRDYEQRFKAVDESLGVVLDRIIQSVQENLEALRSFVERIDEKLSGAVDKLGGGIDELGEFAQSMEQLTARLNGGGNDLQRTR